MQVVSDARESSSAAGSMTLPSAALPVESVSAASSSGAEGEGAAAEAGTLASMFGGASREAAYQRLRASFSLGEVRMIDQLRQ